MPHASSHIRRMTLSIDATPESTTFTRIESSDSTRCYLECVEHQRIWLRCAQISVLCATTSGSYIEDPEEADCEQRKLELSRPSVSLISAIKRGGDRRHFVYEQILPVRG